MIKLLSILSIALPLFAQDATTRLKQLTQTYQAFTSYSGEFLYTQTTPSSNMPLHRKIIVAGEKKRFEVLPPYLFFQHIITVINGKDTIWLIHPEAKTVVVRQHERNEVPELLLVLRASKVEDARYLQPEIVTVENRPHDCMVITGTLKSGPQQQIRSSATYWIDKATGLAVKTVLAGVNGSTTVLVLSFTPNIPIDESQFTYTPKSDEKVIPYKEGMQVRF